MYCNHCGTEIEPNHAFCIACGKPVAAAQPPHRTPLSEHLRLLGIFWIMLSAVRLLGAGALFVVAEFIFGERQEFLWALLTLIGVFVLLLAAGGLAAGWGLWQREPWARSLALGMAAISLIDIPFGTALGIYTLVVLLPVDAEEEFKRLARPA